MKNRTETQALKLRRVTKLGQAVKVHGRNKGVVLKELADGDLVVSTGDGNMSWKDTVPLDKLEVWSQTEAKRSKAHEFYEKVDESCSGGGCTI